MFNSQIDHFTFDENKFTVVDENKFDTVIERMSTSVVINQCK